MIPKSVGVFALGFACGVVTIGIAVMWSSGRPEPPRIESVSAQAHRAMPDPLPSAPPSPAPSVSPPPTVQPPRSTEPAQLHLKMPVDGFQPSKLIDSFDDARAGHVHEALDIAAPRGTPVRAVAEGNVAKLFNSKQGGLTIYQFDNTQTYVFYYAHLDRYAPGLKEGALLRTGEIIGYVGTTGNAPKNVPHLHFAVSKLGPEKKWWEGEALDPLPLLR